MRYDDVPEDSQKIMYHNIEPAGSRLALHLASVTRAPNLQHISDRINLICAQHDLAAPGRQVASLMMFAFEARGPHLFT